MSYTLSQEAISFFMHSYFGIELKELENNDRDTIIIKCAQRAYRDLNRTLRFDNNTTDEQHQEFCNNICQLIKTRICDKLLKSNDKNFNENHKDVCNEICETARDSNVLSEITKAKEHTDEENKKFYYGQAQKWLNMTIKYMWLTGLWKDEFNRLLPVLHIPVDSFIIEAVWHEENEEDDTGKINKNSTDKLLITLPCDNAKRQYKYASEKVISWSKWNETEYENFQTSLKDWCKNNKLTPIEWEGQAWIEIANKRSSL